MQRAPTNPRTQHLSDIRKLIVSSSLNMSPTKQIQRREGVEVEKRARKFGCKCDLIVKFGSKIDRREEILKKNVKKTEIIAALCLPLAKWILQQLYVDKTLFDKVLFWLSISVTRRSWPVDWDFPADNLLTTGFSPLPKRVESRERESSHSLRKNAMGTHSLPKNPSPNPRLEGDNFSKFWP